MKTHFFLTTKRNIAPNPHSRCVGFYNSLKIAEGILFKNWKNLAEYGYYQYAIIEEFGCGWYPDAKTEKWYKFTKNGVKKIKKPKAWESICNFGIG